MTTRSYELSQIASAYDITAAEIAAGVTPSNFAYPPGDVRRYGAKVDSTTDDTAAFQSAVNVAQSGGTSIYQPSGTAKITASINISAKLRWYGDGNQRSILSLSTASTSVYAISISIPDNSSIIGLDIGGIGITANAGAALGCGIYMATTATNSAISQSKLHDIYIRNVTTGVQLNGVVYMCTFSNITCTGTVANYGWYSPNPFSQTIYNSFTDLEVTGTGAGAYAYYLNFASCQCRNLTADGCCYFNGAYNHVQGLAVEGINGATTPSTYCIQANSLFSLSDVDIVNVPNSKCTYGIDLQGANSNVSNVRFPDSGVGNQPDTAINLHAGNFGTISNVQMDRAPVNLLDVFADSILNNYVFSSCSTVTTRGLTYATGTWTPTYSGWSVNPTLVTATYVKIGRAVTVCYYGTGGTSLAGANIAGLPFTSSSTSGSAAAGGCTDTTVRLSGSVVVSATTISNIPAAILTGQYWQLTATYLT